MSKAYILGLLHDATERKTTFRISSKSKKFLKFVARLIKKSSNSAWIYKEGKQRQLYILEFSKSYLSGFCIKTKKDKVDYVKGYFDAEGGIAKSDKVRFYIYFAQKDLKDLMQVKTYLEEMGIKTGKIHNPSIKVDPYYYRFYIKACSYKNFSEKVGSLHPEKQLCFKRVKI